MKSELKRPAICKNGRARIIFSMTTHEAMEICKDLQKVKDFNYSSSKFVKQTQEKIELFFGQIGLTGK